jgi:TolB protein
MIFRCVAFTHRSLSVGGLFIFLFAIQQYSIAQKSYRIVYNVLENREKDNYEIYSMNMNGTDKKNITNTPGVEWVYYAYKDKVYYVSDIDTCHRCYFLYEMDAEGNNKRKISNLQLEDSWMGSRKKGKEMIVTGRVGKKIRQQLFLIDIKTGTYKQLTNDTASYKVDPVFLPGGSSIVLRFRPDKLQRQTVPAELWYMNFYKLPGDTITATNFKYQITHFPKQDTTAKWFEYHAGPPQYNNKYRFISYLSKQNGQTQIYISTPDLKKGWQSPLTSQITSGNLNSGYHSWSSDGKWLAMDKSTPDEKSYDIYLMNYKTKKAVQLTNDAKYEQAPVIVEVNR